MKKLVQGFNTAAQDSNPGSLRRESKALLLNHCDLHTYKHAYIHTYIHTYIHIYIYTYIQIYIHTYIQINIHTNIYIQTLVGKCFKDEARLG